VLTITGSSPSSTVTVSTLRQGFTTGTASITG
jgi:hypothetical protein